MPAILTKIIDGKPVVSDTSRTNKLYSVLAVNKHTGSATQMANGIG